MSTTTEQKKAVARELWLRYFNGILFEQGVITETVRNQMTALIIAKTECSSSTKTSLNSSKG